jgi:hypothetical protein
VEQSRSGAFPSGPDPDQTISVKEQNVLEKRAFDSVSVSVLRPRRDSTLGEDVRVLMPSMPGGHRLSFDRSAAEMHLPPPQPILSEPVVPEPVAPAEPPVSENLDVIQNTDLENGLTQARVLDIRKQWGYNEVTEKKRNPVLQFLLYFWGPIPVMIEVAVILSGITQSWVCFRLLPLKHIALRLPLPV